ncbi:AraC family transcriptional regulator [Vibrio scophthalmi]|uniref:Transcriptional regulator n=2 Tax=Vibrio scophthalmi TaxID=45658 RepID=F9RM82_9VIBR|nr:AraC family transcriptional regulator [Vibrio scophthalmi]ANU37963.1 putative HTH-type transcriptional regulator YbfI [Vibrio scophthalmi]EGU38609.1 transcriptional regulator [Vibrio scophthalmi LMG 19158]
MDRVKYSNTVSESINLIDARYRQFVFQRHYHLDFHIGLITQGEQRFHHQGQNHHVGQGHVVIMAPDELHDGNSVLERGYQTKVFAIDPNWLTQLAEYTQPEQILSFRQSIIANPDIFQQLYQLHLLLGDSDQCQLAKDCLPLEGLEQLFTQFGYGQPEKASPLGRQSIVTLKEFILAHLDEPIRLEQLANMCHLTPTQFQRHFKQKMGITPYAWLSRLRLEQAMKLLQQGHNATYVAHHVGFYDQAHFSKAFKSNFGVPPTQISE